MTGIRNGQRVKGWVSLDSVRRLGKSGEVVEEKLDRFLPPLSPMPAVTVTSRDNCHFAYPARDESGKQHIVIDGRVGPPRFAIDPSAPLFSPDGKRTAYFAAKEGDEMIVVVDGRSFRRAAGWLLAACNSVPMASTWHTRFR